MKIPQIKEGLNYIFQKATTPRAYSAYAVIGVVATVVTTIICTRKQCERESEVMQKTDERDTMTREEAINEIKDICKRYAPMTISAVATIYFISKSNQKWMELNDIVDTARLLAQSKLNNYRAFIPAAAAAEVVNGFGNRAPSETKKWFCIKGLTPEDEMIFFESTDADVLYAEYHLNRNFQCRGTASVKEFYAFLGIADKCDREAGDYFGWDISIVLEDWGLEFAWIDFGHRTYTDPESGTEITEITYLWDPEFTKDGAAYAYESEYAPYGLFPTE